MLKLLKKIIAIPLIGITVLGFVACDNNIDENPAIEETFSEEEKVKLTIYVDVSDEDTREPYEYTISALKEEYPNVELELVKGTRDDGQRIKTYVASGNLTDIFLVNPDLIETFKKSNNILMLDSYAEDFKEKMLERNMNLLIGEDGHIWAFPYAGNEYVLIYYNKSLFEMYGVEVPKTYEELMMAVEAFREKDIIPLSIFAKEKWPCVSLYDIFVTRKASEGIMALNNGTAKASDVYYKEAAEELEKLVKAGLIQEQATNMSYDDAAELFYNEKAAMFINGQWEIESSTKALGDKVDWMYYPAPTMSEVEDSRTKISGGGAQQGFAVSPNSEHRELATEIAAFFALKYAECKYTERGNPLVATNVDLPVQKEFSPMMIKLIEAIPEIKTTSGFPWHITNAKIKDTIEKNTQSLLTGSFSADEFVENVDRDIEQAIK